MAGRSKHLARQLAERTGLTAVKQPHGNTFRLRDEETGLTVAIAVGRKDGSITLQAGADVVNDPAAPPSLRAYAVVGGKDRHAAIIVDEVTLPLGEEMVNLARKHPRRTNRFTRQTRRRTASRQAIAA